MGAPWAGSRAAVPIDAQGAHRAEFELIVMEAGELQLILTRKARPGTI